MSKEAHTPEPWQYGHFGDMALWIGPSEKEINVAEVAHDCSSARDESRANARRIARRIVACVNACAGFPTADLEGGIRDKRHRHEIIADLVASNKQRDELAAALREILAFDSMDYGLHIRGMQKIARAALAKVKS